MICSKPDFASDGTQNRSDGFLMVKQPYSGKCHDHLMCVACVDYILITFGAARLCDIFYAASKSPLDIIAEWEKCIGAERNV